MSDTCSKIIAYEQGDLDYDDALDLFQELGDTGLVFQLQGHYGRTYVDLVERGLIRGPGRTGEEADEEADYNLYDVLNEIDLDG